MEAERPNAAETERPAEGCGAVRRAWPVLAVAAAAQGMQLLYCYLRFFSGRTYEFCHYGEIGRRIATGHGFSTQVALPGTLAVYDKLGVAYNGGWPVLDRFPLYAYWVAAFVRVLGANDTAVLAAAGVAYSMVAALVFWLGRWLVDTRTGLLAAVLFMLSPRLLYFTEGGYTCFLFAAATVGAAAVASSLLTRPGRGVAGRVLAAGVLSVLAWLTRQNFMIWTPLLAGVIAVASPKGKRVLWCGVYVGICAAGAAPMLAYNSMRLGTPWLPVTTHWNLAHLTVMPAEHLPWLQYRVFEPTAILRAHLPELLAKWPRLFFGGFVRDALFFWRMELVAAFFVVSLFMAKSKRLATFLFLSVAMLAVQVVVFSFLRHESTGRYYVWLAPAMTVGASYAVLRLRNPRMRVAAVVVLVAYGLVQLFCYVGPFWYRHHYKGQPYGWALDANYAALDSLLPKGAMVMTNEPTQVAWYLSRPTVALPTKADDALAILSKHPVRFTYITRRLIGFREYGAWQIAIRQAGGPGPFAKSIRGTLVKRFPDSSFLVRHDRGN